MKTIREHVIARNVLAKWRYKSDIKAGTPVSYSYYAHKKVSFIGELFQNDVVYMRKWNRICHTSWLVSMQAFYVHTMIQRGEIYMVRKNKSGRRRT